MLSLCVITCAFVVLVLGCVFLCAVARKLQGQRTRWQQMAIMLRLQMYQYLSNTPLNVELIGTKKKYS